MGTQGPVTMSVEEQKELENSLERTEGEVAPSDLDSDSEYDGVDSDDNGDNGSESSSSFIEDDERLPPFSYVDTDHQVSFLLTPRPPTISLGIGKKHDEPALGSADQLAPMIALQAELALISVEFDVISEWGVGWAWYWNYGGAENYGRIIDAINSCSLVALAVDIGGAGDPPVWSSEAGDVFCNRLNVPGLVSLDLGSCALEDEVLVPGVPKLLDRHPNLQRLTLPVRVRTNYGAFLYPLICESTSLLTVCPHSCRGSSSALFLSWLFSDPDAHKDAIYVNEPHCTCSKVNNPKGNKWALKWSVSLRRNRFLQKSVRRALFGTIAAVRILWRATRGPETTGRSITDLPVEVLSEIARYASPCPWALSHQQLVNVIALATDMEKVTKLHRVLQDHKDSLATRLWMIENGMIWDGGVELADAVFAAS